MERSTARQGISGQYPERGAALLQVSKEPGRTPETGAEWRKRATAEDLRRRI